MKKLKLKVTCWEVDIALTLGYMYHSLQCPAREKYAYSLTLVLNLASARDLGKKLEGEKGKEG